MRRGPLLCILSQAEQPEAENNQIPAMAQKSKRLGLEVRPHVPQTSAPSANCA
jgi:hypothetical protein